MGTPSDKPEVQQKFAGPRSEDFWWAKRGVCETRRDDRLGPAIGGEGQRTTKTSVECQ